MYQMAVGLRISARFAHRQPRLDDKGQEIALADEYEFITAAKDRCHVWLSA